MRISHKINEVLHPILLRYLDRQYRKKICRVKAKRPELFGCAGLKHVREYSQKWRSLSHRRNVDISWYVYHSRLSGVEDIDYVSENIYFAYIEPVLNDLEFASALADKNRLDEFVPRKNVPNVIVRYIRGNFLRADYSWISDEEAQALIDSCDALIVKPSVDSSGGNGVALWRRGDGAGLPKVSDLRKYGNTPLVIQEKITQHPQSAVFNASSVNTCRIMTLRCPWNGQVVVLKSMLRIGCRNEICDNMMLGGVCLGVAPDGRLSKYAYDYEGNRFEVHPVTGLRFAEHALPLYNKMCELALSVAARVPYMNLLSFDMVANRDSEIVCLEMNTAGQGITQLQFDGIPLFREYTDDVIKYCCEHSAMNQFRHFRTFYW